MTLEEQITDAAKRGELTHLSVCFIDGTFRATFTPATSMGFTTVYLEDPVAALKQALSSTKMVRLRAPKEKTPTSGKDEPTREITAPVTDEFNCFAPETPK